jgi:hypothetical protein
LTHPKIERAKKHLAELRTEVGAFLATSPFEVGKRHDPQTREISYYVSRAADVPASISAITADMLQNLRRALDHLACDLVITAGKYPTRNTGFPIFGSLGIYKAQAAEKTQGMQQHAVEAIAAIEPYKGGNDVLWHLQELANIDKHRPLKIAGLAYRFDAVTPEVLAYLRKVWSSRFGDWPPPENAPAELIEHERGHSPIQADDVLFIETSRAGIDSERKFNFDLALAEGRLGYRIPPVERLNGMVDTVGDVVANLDPLLR